MERHASGLRSSAMPTTELSGSRTPGHRMEITVRRIDETEYAEASSLVIQVFRELVAPSMESDGVAVFEAFASPEQIRSRDVSGGATYVATKHGRLLGVLQVANQEHVALFFTCTACHGKGIGRALIEAADKKHALRTVNSSIIAVERYEKFGFRVCGQEQVKNGVRFVPMTR